MAAAQVKGARPLGEGWQQEAQQDPAYGGGAPLVPLSLSLLACWVMRSAGVACMSRINKTLTML